MLKNCRWCNRVHSSPVRDLCQTCYEEEEQEFTMVYDYVREFPGLPVAEVSEATGVQVSRILQYLQQGRLNSQNMEINLACEICGVNTNAGRICDDCRDRLHTRSSRKAPRRMHIAETERYQERQK